MEGLIVQIINENTLKESFINYLIEHRYPQDSIVLEWMISKHHRADMVIIDKDTSKIIALFEFKIKKSDNVLPMAAKQVLNYLNALSDTDIPTYIVLFEIEKSNFSIYQVNFDVNKNETIDLIPEIPKYELLKNKSLKKVILENEKRKSSTFNVFALLCWVMAALTTTLLILDFSNLLEINTQRLALMGIVIALVIVPFASKLNILGLEFERLKEKE